MLLRKLGVATGPSLSFWVLARARQPRNDSGRLNSYCYLLIKPSPNRDRAARQEDLAFGQIFDPGAEIFCFSLKRWRRRLRLLGVVSVGKMVCVNKVLESWSTSVSTALTVHCSVNRQHSKQCYCLAKRCLHNCSDFQISLQLFCTWSTPSERQCRSVWCTKFLEHNCLRNAATVLNGFHGKRRGFVCLMLSYHWLLALCRKPTKWNDAAKFKSAICLGRWNQKAEFVRK